MSALVRHLTLFILPAILLFSGGKLSAQNPSEWKFIVHQKDSVSVGDTIQFKLSRPFVPGAVWSYDIDSSSFEHFEFFYPETSLTTSGEFQLIQNVIFWGHKTDTLKSITYHLTSPDKLQSVYFTTSPIYISPKLFSSPADTMLRGEKEIKLTRLPLWYYAVWLFLAFFLGLGIYLVYRNYVKRKTELKPEQLMVEIQKSPYEIFTESMNQLKLHQDEWLGNIKGYYSELTEILKAYLEFKYNTHVLEMTTDELLGWVKNEPSVQQNMPKLHDVLSRADLIKFAKQDAVLPQMIQDFEYILSSVEKIENTPRFKRNDDDSETVKLNNNGEKNVAV